MAKRTVFLFLWKPLQFEVYMKYGYPTVPEAAFSPFSGARQSLWLPYRARGGWRPVYSAGCGRVYGVQLVEEFMVNLM
jgi:hypothetical protein